MSTKEEKAQMAAIEKFANLCIEAREDDIPHHEMTKLLEWYEDLLDSVTCATLVQQGLAVPHWNEYLDHPEFTLTSEGIEVAENKRNPSDGKTVLN